MTQEIVTDLFKMIVSPGKADYAFGVKKEDVIATMEDLLARIKDGRCVVQGQELKHGVIPTEYAMKHFTVSIAECLRVKSEGVPLEISNINSNNR